MRLRTRQPFPVQELDWGEADSPSIDGAAVSFRGQDPMEPASIQDTPADIALGFMPHSGENRVTRRAAVANFSHPGVSRRELLKQRQKKRRGTLDTELRRATRKAIND